MAMSKKIKIAVDWDGVVCKWVFFPKKSARKSLQKIKQQGFDIYIITGRTGFLWLLSKTFLFFWGLKAIPVIGVGLLAAKNGAKLKTVQVVQPNIFVENNLEIARQFKGVVPFVCLFGSQEAEQGITPVPSWQTLLDFLDNQYLVS